MSGTALTVAAAALTGLLLSLVLCTVLVRLRRQRAARRRATLITPLRPLLLELAAGDALDEGDVRLLLAVPQRTWVVLESDIVDLLAKVRGDGRQALVHLLERRGSVARARGRLSSRRRMRRAAAAELLGVARTAAAVPGLVDLLDDGDSYVRLTAARALGRLGAAEAADRLLHCLRRPGTAPTVVVAEALLGIGPAAHPALTFVLDDPNPLLRSVAADVLGLTGATAAVSALQVRLGADPAEGVRLRAARALGRIGLPSALSALTGAALGDQVVAVQVAAVSALAELGDRGAVAVLLDLLDAPAPALGSAAAEGLLLLDPEGPAALVEAAAVPDGRAGAQARAALAQAAVRGLVVPVAGVPA